MSKANKIVGKITQIERMRSSVNGNPRFMITILMPVGATHTAPTGVDAMLAYGIENPEYRDHDHEWTLDGRGNVVYGEPYVSPVNHDQVHIERTMRD